MNAESIKACPLATWRESFGAAETPGGNVFHRPRLYLETTIFSYLTARMNRDLKVARMQRITLRWWDSWHTQFDIYVSGLLPDKSARITSLIRATPRVLGGQPLSL